MTLRVLIAIFAGITALITGALIPVAYLGDKNVSWANRLAMIACVAAMIFVAAWLW
jgi:hypothetical protein